MFNIELESKQSNISELNRQLGETQQSLSKKTKTITRLLRQNRESTDMEQLLSPTNSGSNRPPLRGLPPLTGFGGSPAGAGRSASTV